MNEEFLHYIWKFQQFKREELTSTLGENLQILKAGIHNHDSGPDFFNGQIRIGETRWAGNIEIHTKSSDWKLHQHQKDKLYDKVILHVVWKDDEPVFRKNGNPIPTLELKGLVKKNLLDKYQELKQSSTWIPCEKELLDVSSITKRQVIDQMMVERLQQKSDRINQVLNNHKNDWEATLFQLMTKYFGFKVNAVPFEVLATSLPYQLIRKHSLNNRQLEALLFGQAGFLEHDFIDEYPKELNKEYLFLKRKYGLHSIDESMWKFMRMRPANFPTIRIAQLATCLVLNKNLFQKVLEIEKLDDLRSIFNISINDYWNNHFRFDLPSLQEKEKKLGRLSVDILIINVLVPILFSYGKIQADERYCERALCFLQELKSEVNQIIKKWRELKMPLDSAYESQALIQLKTRHCDIKKCLSCSIGSFILKKTSNDS